MGAALALLREQSDDRIRSKDALERTTRDLPTLGLIPRVDERRDERSSYLVAVNGLGSPSAEAYRGLRTCIQFLGFDKPVKTLQITSPVAAEGK
jgi:succinoglycan biosynthesis transport protein ExoP